MESFNITGSVVNKPQDMTLGPNEVKFVFDMNVGKRGTADELRKVVYVAKSEKDVSRCKSGIATGRVVSVIGDLMEVYQGKGGQPMIVVSARSLQTL